MRPTHFIRAPFSRTEFRYFTCGFGIGSSTGNRPAARGAEHCCYVIKPFKGQTAFSMLNVNQGIAGHSGLQRKAPPA